MIRKQEKCEWDFIPAMKAHISDECKDFLSHLLEPDPQKRYDMKQVLKHPWMPKVDKE